MRIVRAEPENAPTLTAIALTAKRHWGYPETWIDRWRAELTITPDYVRTHPTFATVASREMVGFYAVRLHADAALLDHLWVLPAEMGRGIGRALFVHAEEMVRAAGSRRLTVAADPNAEGFYRRMGATTMGREPAPMDGHQRYIPQMEKLVAQSSWPCPSSGGFTPRNVP